MFEGLAQPMHLLVLLFIAILFFGPSKLGDFGKGLGDGIRHFKNALKENTASSGQSASSSAATSTSASTTKKEDTPSSTT